MVRTRLFRSSRSQAIRFTREVSHPDNGTQENDPKVVSPANAIWDDFFNTSGIDFPDRDQPQL